MLQTLWTPVCGFRIRNNGEHRLTSPSTDGTLAGDDLREDDLLCAEDVCKCVRALPLGGLKPVPRSGTLVVDARTLGQAARECFAAAGAPVQLVAAVARVYNSNIEQDANGDDMQVDGDVVTAHRGAIEFLLKFSVRRRFESGDAWRVVEPPVRRHWFVVVHVRDFLSNCFQPFLCRQLLVQRTFKSVSNVFDNILLLHRELDAIDDVVNLVSRPVSSRGRTLRSGASRASSRSKCPSAILSRGEVIREAVVAPTLAD